MHRLRPSGRGRANADGEFWAIDTGSRCGVTVVVGLIAVHTADVQPCYQSGQIAGVLGGLKGAAEHEARIGRIGYGTAGMRSQKVVHYLIVAFVIMGNIACINQRRRRQMESTSVDVFWMILAGFMTLAIYSFPYRDNAVCGTDAVFDSGLHGGGTPHLLISPASLGSLGAPSLSL